MMHCSGWLLTASTSCARELSETLWSNASALHQSAGFTMIACTCHCIVGFALVGCTCSKLSLETSLG